MTQQIVPIVGLEKLYAAKILKDDESGVEFDTPKYLPGIKEIALKPNISTEPFYAENIEWLSETTLANVEVEVDIADLSDEDEAFLLGHKLAKEGGIIKSANDIAPDVALLFKANKGKGENRYQILYKGNFSTSDDSYKGKEGKSEFQSRKLKASFAPLRHNKMWMYKIDSDSPNVPEGLDKTFFKEVIVPTEKTESEPEKEKGDI